MTSRVAAVVEELWQRLPSSKRWRWVASFILVATVTSGSQAVADHLGTAFQPAIVRFAPSFPWNDFVALSGGRWLVYGGDGHARLRAADGTWSPVFRLAITQIQAVSAVERGFIATGTIDADHSGVVLMSADGAVLDQWLFTANVSSVISDELGFAAIIRDGLIPLLPGGKLGPLERFDAAEQMAVSATPTVLRRDLTGYVLCWDRNLTLASKAPGRCRRTGLAGWMFEGDFASPMVCGNWILALEGGRSQQLAIYSVVTGKMKVRIRYPVKPALACASPGIMLAGASDLSLLTLPADKPTWTKTVADGPVIAVAAGSKEFAYQVDNSVAVTFVQRPSTTSHPASVTAVHR